jgi:hypothetical protein
MHSVESAPATGWPLCPGRFSRGGKDVVDCMTFEARDMSIVLSSWVAFKECVAQLTRKKI